MDKICDQKTKCSAQRNGCTSREEDPFEETCCCCEKAGQIGEACKFGGDIEEDEEELKNYRQYIVIGKNFNHRIYADHYEINDGILEFKNHKFTSMMIVKDWFHVYCGEENAPRNW